MRSGLARAGVAPADLVRLPGFDLDAGLTAAPAPGWAFVCVDDEIALGVPLAAEAVGLRVPQDLAVTGWDEPEVDR